MECITLFIQIMTLIVLPIWLYLWFNKYMKNHLVPTLGIHYTELHFVLKRWWATWCISKRKKAEKENFYRCAEKYGFIKLVKPHLEDPIILKDENSCDSILFYGSDQKGNSIFIKLTRRGYRTAELSFLLTLSNGQVYVLPDYPNTVILDNVNHGWTAKDLKIVVLEAQQRWRITYNGMLRNKPTTDIGSALLSVHHIRLNCIFIANSLALEWPGDWSTHLHADVLAQEPWKSPQWINKMELVDHGGYDQWGSIIGQIRHEDASVTDLYLRGLCQRRWGKHESYQFEKTVMIIGTTLKGTMCCFGASILKDGSTHIQFGHVKRSDETVREIDWMDLNINNIAHRPDDDRTRHEIRYTVSGKKYVVVLNYSQDTATFLYYGQPWNWENCIHNVKFELNGDTGIGIVQSKCPYDGPQSTKPIHTKIKYPLFPEQCIKPDEYVVFFDDSKCQNENFVGGKAASLALLTSVKDGDFVVPPGFCVTTFAFDLQIQSHEVLQRVINDIENISSGKQSGDLKEHCEKAVLIIQSTDVNELVKDAILKAVKQLESDDRSSNLNRYAIRSSAVGEDSEETSAAGQNSTYLGIEGERDIINKIAMCWGSLFSYQSVEYRRQNCLPIRATMGICVQRMVNAEAAGVMFTRHPTTGNPSDIIITSNYGLGETVVSAAVEPDTLIIHRGWDDNLTIKDSTVGRKNQKMLMTQDGVTTTNVDREDVEKVSVSNETALRLAKVGLHLESLFGAPRDIEWAINEAQMIFLLQARPITTLDTWTDFEILHELDCGVPADMDILTFANVGEVLPNPLSPLTMSTVIRLLNASIEPIEFDRIYLYVTGMRCSISYFSTLLQFVEKNITMNNKVMDIALCGHTIITPEIHKHAVERNGIMNLKKRCIVTFKTFKDAWQNEWTEKKAQKAHDDYTLNTDNFRTAHDLYVAMSRMFEGFHKIAVCHSITSKISVVYQSIALSILTSGNEDILPDHFADIAIVLSSCNSTISSQVPVLLRKIALCIKNSGNAESFSKVKTSEAIEWLKVNCPTAAQQIEILFRDHGHRGIQELDFFFEPWSLRPETLISTIQVLALSVEESNTGKELSVEETVQSLKTLKSGFAKWFLKKIVPLCRSAVNRREITKSLLASYTHKLRLAYRKLGKLMVTENYLPDEELIFFVTHQEIENILSGRGASLIRRAIRRRRIYPQAAKFQYAEFNNGICIPIKDPTTINTSLDESNKIQGVSVSGGSILGRACVITTLSNAKDIRQGDILITHATDIGWSPYFPLLGGVVTELGGLISHGAVVAREYGLPCIVGAKGATQLFETGDIVLLAADFGVLQLVEKIS